MDDKMVKCFDSKNNEWIVDGDLYLIKTISQYPILWDRKNFDSDQRNEVWLKLSKKLKIKCKRKLKLKIESLNINNAAVFPCSGVDEKALVIFTRAICATFEADQQ